LESLVTVKKQVCFKVSQKARARRIWLEKAFRDFSFPQIFSSPLLHSKNKKQEKK